MIDFDPMRGPAAQAVGSAGIVTIAGLRAGTLSSWRLVLSPTAIRKDASGAPILGDDGKPIPAYTLFGEGSMLRFFRGALGVVVTASLTPSTPPTRIGRPKPKTPRPFTLAGVVAELSARRIVIAAGEIIVARG